MPTQFIWRPVITKQSDELQFERGGERYLIVLGILHLAVCLFCVWGALRLLPMDRDQILSSLRMKDYHAVLLWYVLSCVPSLLALEFFMLGVWGVFGRTEVVVNRFSKSVTKVYQLHSFPIFRRIYDLTRLESVTFRRAGGLWAVFGLFAISLDDESDGSRKLLMVPKKFGIEGQGMAGEIASFLGVPGPLE